MQKIAQRREITDWVSEKTNLVGGFSELWSDKFKAIMEKLRKCDSKARAIIMGKSISQKNREDPNDPTEQKYSYNTDDPRPLKEILKTANSLFNRREYITVVKELGVFHEKMQLVSDTLSGFRCY